VEGVAGKPKEAEAGVREEDDRERNKIIRRSKLD